MLKSSAARRLDPAASKISRYLFIAKRTWAWALFKRMIESFQSRNPEQITVTDYESLRLNKERVLESVCRFIGVDLTPDMVGDRYERDTSFASQGAKRSRVLSGDEIFTTRVFAAIWSALPTGVLRRLRSDRLDARRVQLPDWFFRINRNCHDGSSDFGRSSIDRD